MEPITIATAIATIFFTKAVLESLSIDPIFKVKSLKQKAPAGSGEQTMLKNVKITGDIDLGDLSQEA